MKATMKFFRQNTLYIIAATALFFVHPVFATEFKGSAFDLKALAPAAPAVADFSDGAPVTDINLADLAPTPPKEAEFGDEPVLDVAVSVSDLAPVTPKEADFE
ncbi:MAG TPA: hypothetical protein PKG48_06430 [Bacteroidales bacterium]|nr:hypothetical protein [Bacteroidales bacterium]HPS63394.1 hypothetical protein [Bacteroidales bacterium]